MHSAGRMLGGRYRLIREIARGGMGAVWEAEDTLLDRHVAVKLLHPQYADDPEFLERFRREARAAARLSHPNIVPIYDVGEDSEMRTPFIVMELVEGGSLKDRIRRAAVGRRDPYDRGDARRDARLRPPQGPHPPRCQAAERADG